MKKMKKVLLSILAGMSLLLSSCGFNVIKTIKSITLNETSYNLEIGQSFKLVAQIEPEEVVDSLVWTSSNAKVASVSEEGLVVGLSEGEATVTAASLVHPDIFATCEFTVNKPYVPVSSVSLESSSISMVVGSSKSLKCTVLPSDATNRSLTWTSSVEGVVEIDNGNITPINEGETVITATSVDKPEISSSCTIKVNDTRGEYNYISSLDQLKIGSYIVITNGHDSTVSAMKDFVNNSSDRSGTSISVKEDVYDHLGSSSVAAFELVEGKIDGTYAFYDLKVGKYLCAGGSSSLRVSDEITDAASFDITFDYQGAASIVSHINSGSNVMRYSSRQALFRLYQSSQSNRGNKVYLFSHDVTPIYAQSIELIGQEELAIGDSFNCSVKYNPVNTNKKKVTWSSSDPSIASISSEGIVNGLKEGYVTLTASVIGEGGAKISDTLELHVKSIALTSISIQSSLETTVGRNTSLVVSYTPSNATNKKVSWTSSNPSVASVNNGEVVAIKAGTTIITATSEDGGYITTCNVTVNEKTLDSWTIMIYMCGSDLESSYASSYQGLASGDIREILSVYGQPDDINIIIETGGSTKWERTYGISEKNLERWHVENQQLVKDERLSQGNMAASKTFESFMNWGLKEYPAEKVGVILWNHGGGMQGVCYDDNYSDDYTADSLLSSEFMEAMDNVFETNKISEKLEWVGYDACLMQVQDLAYNNSKYFNYMLASQESESGYGWDYDTWIDDLYAEKSTETILKAIVDGFIYDNGGTTSSSNDQTLSYLDLSYAEEYKTAWESMADKLASKVSSGNKTQFNSLIKSCKYYADNDYTYFGLFDAKDFINKLSSNSTFNPGSSYLNNILSIHSKLVKYSSCGRKAGNSYGLSMFWAISRNCYQTEVYTASETSFANWMKLNRSYGY